MYREKVWTVVDCVVEWSRFDVDSIVEYGRVIECGFDRWTKQYRERESNTESREIEQTVSSRIYLQLSQSSLILSIQGSPFTNNIFCTITISKDISVALFKWTTLYTKLNVRILALHPNLQISQYFQYHEKLSLLLVLYFFCYNWNQRRFIIRVNFHFNKIIRINLCSNKFLLE